MPYYVLVAEMGFTAFEVSTMWCFAS